jgi:hypothetical protein
MEMNYFFLNENKFDDNKTFALFKSEQYRFVSTKIIDISFFYKIFLANTTAVVVLFKRICDQFAAMFRRPGSIVPATGSRRIFQERCGKVTGSCRKTREIPGTWKQYSGREFPGFF